jgi:hypothetical protein
MNITHICQFCSLNELETVDHVVTRCPLYDQERQTMLLNLQIGLTQSMNGLYVYHSLTELDQCSLTMVMLGNHDPNWSLETSALIHRVARQYFLVCWEKRTRMLGKQPGLTKDGFLTVYDHPMSTVLSPEAQASMMQSVPDYNPAVTQSINQSINQTINQAINPALFSQSAISQTFSQAAALTGSNAINHMPMNMVA